ncbi:hypothetical protein ABTQ33_12120 [Paucilactobacillus suebicus]|uniref:hypothetical protein n=1 Tax=Paucilactobacillus suebicus TaxID=152335 RepID=UPI0002DCCCB2|nr:hypothetical protein [Paucilactobacillus suebicus]
MMKLGVLCATVLGLGGVGAACSSIIQRGGVAQVSQMMSSSCGSSSHQVGNGGMMNR